MFRRSNMPSSSSSSSPANDDIIPRTVLDIFSDFSLRRLGFLRAFTIDVASFYYACDPEMVNLCAYAYPNGSWDVTPPAVVGPPLFPEPILGINFARDGMQWQEWLLLAASYCDCWLLSLAYFFSAWLTREDRTRLFDMTNNLPTLVEEVRLLYSI